TSKARRLGRLLTTRDELRRRVRAAVAASLSEGELFARLSDDGVLVSLRRSQINPDEVTGYAVALPSDVDASGRPGDFGASKVAPDLSLPKLRIRWGTARPGTDEKVRVSPAERATTLAEAAAMTRVAADEIARVAGSDPQAAQAMAQAAADTLTAI